MGTENKLDNYRQLMISIMKMARAEYEEEEGDYTDYDRGVIDGLSTAIYKLEASKFLTEEEN